MAKSDRVRNRLHVLLHLTDDRNRHSRQRLASGVFCLERHAELMSARWKRGIGFQREEHLLLAVFVTESDFGEFRVTVRNQISAIRVSLNPEYYICECRSTDQ